VKVLQIGGGMKVLKVVLPLLLVASLSAAKQINGKVVTQKTSNSTCEKTDSCSLKEFKIRQNEYVIKLAEGGSPSYGTNVFMSYKTSTVKDLTDYAIVQFIKGCRFKSFKNAEGKIEKHMAVRFSFGEKINFAYPNWAVDSDDKDPMYQHGDTESRHGYYRWMDGDKPVSYVRRLPTNPELYVSDIPGTASMDKPTGIADNISLEFKTCVYKTTDVPVSSTADDLNFAKPIQCLGWRSSYIYNHKKDIFESPATIDSFCK
jgi:hypothetical protein